MKEVDRVKDLIYFNDLRDQQLERLANLKKLKENIDLRLQEKSSLSRLTDSDRTDIIAYELALRTLQEDCLMMRERIKKLGEHIILLLKTNFPKLPAQGRHKKIPGAEPATKVVVKQKHVCRCIFS